MDRRTFLANLSRGAAGLAGAYVIRAPTVLAAQPADSESGLVLAVRVPDPLPEYGPLPLAPALRAHLESISVLDTLGGIRPDSFSGPDRTLVPLRRVARIKIEATVADTDSGAFSDWITLFGDGLARPLAVTFELPSWPQERFTAPLTSSVGMVATYAQPVATSRPRDDRGSFWEPIRER